MAGNRHKAGVSATTLAAAAALAAPAGDPGAPGTTVPPPDGLMPAAEAIVDEVVREASYEDLRDREIDRPIDIDGPAAPTRQEEAAEAAAGALWDGRPEDAVRASEAVAGSALDAPGVGSGPVGDRLRSVRPLIRAAGTASIGGVEVAVGESAAIPPAIMSREGSFGPVPERDALLRRQGLAAEVAQVRLTAAKLARAVPSDPDEFAELQDAGFDFIVTSKQDGFRRAGVAHPSAPTLRRSVDFTNADIEAMARDPMLIVQALRPAHPDTFRAAL